MGEFAEILVRTKDATAQGWADVQATASSAIGKINSLIPGLFTALSAAGLVTFAKQALDSADQLEKMSQKTGIAVEELSKLKYAAQQSNVDIDRLALGIKKMSTNAFDASADTGKAAETFKLLGVSATDATGQVRPTGELLLELADRFSIMHDGATKSALAVRLFGKAGDELIPFLNKGRDGIEELTGEAARLGLTLTGEGAEAAKKFETSVRMMEAASKSLGVAFINEMSPVLVQVATQMREAAIVGGAFYAVLIGIANLGKIRLFGIDPTEMQKQLEVVNQLTRDLSAAKGNLEWVQKATGSDLWGMKSAQEYTQQIASLNLGLQRAYASLELMQGKANLAALSGPPAKEPPPGLPGATGKADVDAIQQFIDKQNEMANNLAAGYERTRALLGQVTEEAKVRYDTEFGKLAIVDDAIKANLITRAKELDAANLQILTEKSLAAATLSFYEQQAQFENAGAVNMAKNMAELDKADLKKKTLHMEELKRIDEKTAHLILSLGTESVREQTRYDEEVKLLVSANANKLMSDAAYFWSRTALSQQHAARMVDIETRKNAQIRSMEITTWQLGADLLMQFSGKSQAAAIAVIAIQKGLAIAQVVMNAQVAVMRGYAELGPYGGTAFAAEMAVLEGVQIGLIAATGIAQVANLSGGGASLGSPANPVNTTSGVTAVQPMQTAAQSAPSQTTIIHVNIAGETISRKQINALFAQINEAARDGGRIVIE